MPAAVSIKDLRFAYAENTILNLKSLEIREGETTLICGESGCGKSTLLNLVSGILSGHTGMLAVMGQNLGALNARRRDRFRAQNISVIFQQFNLIPYLTVRENVILGTTLAGKHQDWGRVQGMLEHLQIADLADMKAVNLSHGQQQRVAAARALTKQAGVILADEPTSALDDRNSRLFLDLLFREARAHKTAVLVVTHDLRYKKRFDRVIDLTRINKRK